MGKLTDDAATRSAAELLGAMAQLSTRHGWDAGDLLAVMMLATNEVVCRVVGPSRAANFFRDHADGIEAEHAKRATI